MIRLLLAGATYEVHGSRLRFYADTPLNVTEEIRELSRTRVCCWVWTDYPNFAPA
ncbi:hypothetical protein PI125_g12347 [Phytophthora idaei]|nr:hypothetical protein PI125_g12347 [Phytophthora idaei]